MHVDSTVEKEVVMIQIDTRSQVPIFEQIVLEIGKYIALGIYKPNDQLPSVRSLAKDLGINPNTVAKAYNESERIGLTYSEAGRGNFIADKKQGLDPLIEPIYIELTQIVKRLLELGESKNNIIQVIEKEAL